MGRQVGWETARKEESVRNGPMDWRSRGVTDSGGGRRASEVTEGSDEKRGSERAKPPHAARVL